MQAHKEWQDWSETSLAAMFREKTGFGLTHEEFEEYCRMCVMYMFRSIKAADLRRWLRDFIGTDKDQALAISESIRDDGYLVTNLKLFLADCYYYKVADRDGALFRTEDFRLAGRTEQDACLASCVNSPAVKKSFKGFLDNPLYVPVTLPQMEQVMEWLAEDSMYKVRSMAYRTRFIHGAYGSGLDREDVLQELSVFGLKAVWNKYPRLETYDHALALACRQIGNEGINLIKSFTTDKNSVIRRIGEHEFAAVITSMDKVISTDDGDGTTMGDLIADPASSKGYDFVEYSNTIERLRDLAENDLESDMVECILGFKNEDFTKWLRINAAQTHRIDNDELFEKLLGKRNRYDDYMIGYLDEAYPMQNEAGVRIDGSAEMKELLDDMRGRMRKLVK